MQILELTIKNFKSIRELEIGDIPNALILVGQNNTGKTAVIDAIRAAFGCYSVTRDDFQDNLANIEIGVKLHLDQEDLSDLQKRGIISHHKSRDAWLGSFAETFSSWQPDGQKGGSLYFTFVANRDGKVRYAEGEKKNCPQLAQIFPTVYDLDPQSSIQALQDQILLQQEDRMLGAMRRGECMFDAARKCNDCFSCIGLINKKKPEELTAHETLRLLDYKLYQISLDKFSGKVNECYRKNGGQETICYSMNRDVERMLSVTTEYKNGRSESLKPIASLGDGMRSIYALSLLETCSQEEGRMPGLILVEEPELFLHPQLQKVCGDILYRLAQKNQVIFSTHSPNLLPDFNSRQIRQVVLDADGYSAIRKHTDISEILNDLGYTANDLMNVDFVFIVEGKQDKSRLPLLLKRYYGETYDEEGRLSRAAIITTNSCTNIRTYANLKYINQVYLKDNFLMIRDGDGKDPQMLRESLCDYYKESNRRDADGLPKVKPENVLILKYYSFENYFFNPKIMAAVGVVKSEEEFYRIFLEKWKEYLCRLSSGKKLTEAIGCNLETEDDVRNHMEDIRIHLRGHNLYDLFYGRFRRNENEILEKYIDLAPKSDFADIFEAIERFIYFQNRKKKQEENE